MGGIIMWNKCISPFLVSMFFIITCSYAQQPPLVIRAERAEGIERVERVQLGVGLRVQIVPPPSAHWYPFNVTYDSYPLVLEFQFKKTGPTGLLGGFRYPSRPIDAATWSQEKVDIPLMRLVYNLYDDEGLEPFFSDSVDLYGNYGPGFLVVKPGIEVPHGVSKLRVNATLSYEKLGVVASSTHDIYIDVTEAPGSGRYQRYREGYIRRHLVSAGRGLSWVWLKEYEPGVDPKELLYHSRTFVVPGNEPVHHPVKVYVPWLSEADGAIYGGDENPLLRGGLAMATFSLEYLSTGNLTSLLYARDLFKYVEASEYVDDSGTRTGFFLRSRWPGDTNDKKTPPWHASIDEIAGMTLGMYYLHLALEKAGSSYYDADHDRVKALVERLGNQMRSNYFFLVPPQGLPQERHNGWSGGYIYQWYLNGGFRAITGKSFKPAGDVLKVDSDAWRRIKRPPWGGPGSDDTIDVEKLVDLEFSPGDRAVLAVQGLGVQMYWGEVGLPISTPLGPVNIDIKEFKQFNFPMLLHMFQLGMADAANRDSDRIEEIKKEMRRFIRGVLFPQVALTRIDLDQILDAYLGSWTPIHASMEVAVGAQGAVPDYYAAAIAKAYDLFPSENTQSRLDVLIGEVRGMLADSPPVGQRGGIADVTVHDVWSVENSDGKIILNHNPFGKLGKAFVWESAPRQAPGYSGWVQDGGSDGGLGLSNGLIEETYIRQVDVMLEGAGLGFLMPTALLHYKKGMFASDILGIMHDPDLLDTKLGACTSSPQPDVEPCHYKWPHREGYDDHENNDAFESATPIAFGPVQNLNLDHSGDRGYDRIQAVYYSSNDNLYHNIWWHTDDVDYYRVQNDGDYKLGVAVFVQDGYSLTHRLVVDGIEVTAGTPTPGGGISKWMRLEVPAKTKHLIMFTGDAADYRMYVAPVPTADDLIVTTNEDNEVSITLAGSEHSGLTTTFIVRDRPSHGYLVGSPPTVTYVPNMDFHGHDQFSYRASLGMYSSEPAIVSIEVLSINDAPVAFPSNVTVPMNIPTSIQLHGSDPHDNWGPVSMFKIIEKPTTGNIGVENLQELRVKYVPESGFTGTVTFKFIVSDGELWSDPATVTINVVSD
jgi:hypothetical protein